MSREKAQTKGPHPIYIPAAVFFVFLPPSALDTSLTLKPKQWKTHGTPVHPPFRPRLRPRAPLRREEPPGHWGTRVRYKVPCADNRLGGTWQSPTATKVPVYVQVYTQSPANTENQISTYLFSCQEKYRKLLAPVPLYTCFLLKGSRHEWVPVIKEGTASLHHHPCVCAPLRGVAKQRGGDTGGATTLLGSPQLITYPLLVQCPSCYAVQTSDTEIKKRATNLLQQYCGILGWRSSTDLWGGRIPRQPSPTTAQNAYTPSMVYKTQSEGREMS